MKDRTILPSNLAHLPQVTSYADVSEAFTSRDFGQAGYEGSTEFLEGSLVTIDGDAHRKRVKVEKPLFQRDSLLQYEREVLIPSIEHRLNSLSASEDGLVHADLIPLSRGILTQIAAKIIGIDDVDDPARIERLAGMAGPLAQATRLKFAVGDKEALRRDCLEVKRQYVEEFIAPSRARRAALVKQWRAGQLAREELPRDVLTVLLVESDPSWDDDLINREAILYLVGATLTTAQAVPHALFHIFEWLEERPDQRHYLDDVEFLRHAAYESMRLHASSPTHMRVTKCDVTLPSGRHFPAGTEVAVMGGAADVDPAMFGEDPEQYDPLREPLDPKVKHYGATFAYGEHKCIGSLLAAGMPASRDQDNGTQGMVIRILSALLDRGVMLDPDHPPQRDESTVADFFLSFPILFRAS